MRHPKLSGQLIEILITSKLTITETRILMLWLCQSANFHPSTGWLAKKLDVHRTGISRALINLTDRGILIVASYTEIDGKRAIKNYELSDKILSAANNEVARQAFLRTLK